MRFTLSWLKEHLDTHTHLGEIVDRLTALGIEVEEVMDRGALLEPFTVARIVAAEPHPDADRLQVCTVDTGTEQVQVVCGAANARKGLKGVFARTGTTVPGTGLKLKKTKIRGVESHGMMCSAMEMGLGEAHDGIIELPEDAPLGIPFAGLAGLDDPVIDVAITPNRADCTGVLGIARDLAAAGMGKIKPRQGTPVKNAFKGGAGVTLDFKKDTADACPLFVARTIRGVKNGASPQWLVDRLTAVGLRPISALVDITNYLTLDLARPLHVYDAAKLAGDLVVRLSKKGEILAALDDKDYVLEDGMTVITDGSGVLGLGGVIGGVSTGCGSDTTSVVLESALFDPVRTAATGRRLMIDSDARYRFERGVDPESVLPGMEAATAMILDFCGGEAGEPMIAGAVPDLSRTITLRTSRIPALGGVEMDADTVRHILRPLGFTVSDTHDELTVVTPSWRHDVEGEADLVEELLRVHGYDQIPAVSLPRETALPEPALSPRQLRERYVRRQLAARGMVEAVTWSFMNAAVAELFGGGGKNLTLVNPISADLDVMRPAILPNLLTAAAWNQARGQGDCALFEIGPAYADASPEGQAQLAAGLRSEATGVRHWSGETRPVDAFDAKADALAALAACGVAADALDATDDAPSWYHPGRSGSLCLAVKPKGPKTVLAHFGEIHPGILSRLDVKGSAVGFELFLNEVPEPKKKKAKTRDLLDPSPFQSVVRDFAFVVDADVSAAMLVSAVMGADKKTGLIADVDVFDLYTGEGMAEGEKSLALAVTLQPRSKTLTDEEIEAVGDKITAAVAKATGARLRG